MLWYNIQLLNVNTTFYVCLKKSKTEEWSGLTCVDMNIADIHCQCCTVCGENVQW